MARLYSDENLLLAVVRGLRSLGHDVLTAYEAGNANRSIPDREVLDFAASQERILLTLNRRHFVRIHEAGGAGHTGIVVCTFDADFGNQARRIHDAVVSSDDLRNRLIRVNRPTR
jgi:predicted nuclease of predicted toxin-antitoxin system